MLFGSIFGTGTVSFWPRGTSSLSGLVAAGFLAGSLILAPIPGLAQSEDTPEHWIRLAIQRVCGNTDARGLEVESAFPGSWLLEESRHPNNGTPNRIRFKLALSGGHDLVLESRLFNGQLRQFRASYFESGKDGLLPRLLAIADGGCTVQSSRKIRAEGEAWRYLVQMTGDLETVRWTEILQAPWPQGADPGGVRVALVDSGLAYDLPLFRGRLARDESGTPLGYDFWDLDPWPYDGDTARGAFLPIRHGTAVASVLAREAPDAALIPYRYPRPDMSRLADIVARAADAGARILAMPLGSRKRGDWVAFEQALKQHDMLAIVSAGNDGRDIDLNPVYPAGLGLDNMLTVTSADGFGRLASGSNWGGTSVDIMLPAENLEVVDFRGASGAASGSSFAVPRLAALAARYLSQNPDMSIAGLKARILARAVPSPYEREGVVSAGWIPDPLAD